MKNRTEYNHLRDHIDKLSSHQSLILKRLGQIDTLLFKYKQTEIQTHTKNKLIENYLWRHVILFNGNTIISVSANCV